MKALDKTFSYAYITGLSNYYHEDRNVILNEVFGTGRSTFPRGWIVVQHDEVANKMVISYVSSETTPDWNALPKQCTVKDNIKIRDISGLMK